MKINVHIVNDDKEYHLILLKTALAGDTLKKLEVPPDTVIITRNNQPIPLDSPLEAGDELAVIRVLSGG
jgi:sulfur carrier protein ThiS